MESHDHELPTSHEQDRSLESPVVTQTIDELNQSRTPAPVFRDTAAAVRQRNERSRSALQRPNSQQRSIDISTGDNAAVADAGRLIIRIVTVG